jgi:D-alanine transaminase
MPELGFLNGRFLPLAEATVSVEDRGFQFADGVYEVVRTYHGQPFHLQAHLARLERSAAALQLPMPYSGAQWTEVVSEGIRRAGYPESKVYLQLTRGVAPRDHAYPTSVSPTVVMTVRQMVPLDPARFATGVSVMTVDDVRWGRCDIKSINLLANVLARQRAREAGAFEAIFIRSGMVTEGAVSNVMMIKNGRLLTAPEGPFILAGVTRQLVLELARKEGLDVLEQDVMLEELTQVDEIVLTGTTVEVLPVVSCDRKTIGRGRPGEVANWLRARFSDLIAMSDG